MSVECEAGSWSVRLAPSGMAACFFPVRLVDLVPNLCLVVVHAQRRCGQPGGNAPRVFTLSGRFCLFEEPRAVFPAPYGPPLCYLGDPLSLGAGCYSDDDFGDDCFGDGSRSGSEGMADSGDAPDERGSIRGPLLVFIPPPFPAAQRSLMEIAAYFAHTPLPSPPPSPSTSPTVSGLSLHPSNHSAARWRLPPSTTPRSSLPRNRCPTSTTSSHVSKVRHWHGSAVTSVLRLLSTESSESARSSDSLSPTDTTPSTSSTASPPSPDAASTSDSGANTGTRARGHNPSATHMLSASGGGADGTALHDSASLSSDLFPRRANHASGSCPQHRSESSRDSGSAHKHHHRHRRHVHTAGVAGGVRGRSGDADDGEEDMDAELLASVAAVKAPGEATVALSLHSRRLRQAAAAGAFEAGSEAIRAPPLFASRLVRHAAFPRSSYHEWGRCSRVQEQAGHAGGEDVDDTDEHPLDVDVASDGELRAAAAAVAAADEMHPSAEAPGNGITLRTAVLAEAAVGALGRSPRRPLVPVPLLTVSPGRRHALVLTAASPRKSGAPATMPRGVGSQSGKDMRPNKHSDDQLLPSSNCLPMHTSNSDPESPVRQRGRRLSALAAVEQADQSRGNDDIRQPRHQRPRRRRVGAPVTRQPLSLPEGWDRRRTVLEHIIFVVRRDVGYLNALQLVWVFANHPFLPLVPPISS